MYYKLYLSLFIVLSPVFNKCFAQAPDMRSVDGFVMFTTTGAVGNTNFSLVSGKIGTNAGAITGFTPVPGQEEHENSVTLQAAADILLIYDELYNAPQNTPTHAPVLGMGETLVPGVYQVAGAGSISGILTLDAQGDPNAVFIFKIAGAFSPGPSSQVLLINGASACNVFWAAEGGAIAIATLADMKGTFIANPGAVSMAASGELEGRLLSTTGAIAVDGVTTRLPVCNFIILPVQIIDFKASKKDREVELSWTAADENSMAGYELQRSADGGNFTGIALITPAHNPLSTNYTRVDNAPFPGINFYRLKIKNTDGSSKYSPVLKISMNGGNNISIFPNPVTNHTVLLQLYGQPKGDYFIDIYNVKGEKVMTTKILHGENDEARSIRLDESLLPGIYFLQIACPVKLRQVLKIVIQ